MATHLLRLSGKKRFWRYLSPSQRVVLLALVLIAGLLLIAMSVAAGLKERELENALRQKTALRRLSADIALVMRYRAFRERPQRLESESPLAEAEMLAEAENDLQRSEIRAAWPLARIEKISLLFSLSGRASDRQQRYDALLYAAYLGERRRHYRAAEALWNRALGFEIAGEEEAFVLLHRGFCRLFTGARQEAAADLTRAAELAPSGSIGHTAFSLLVFLHEGRVRFAEIAQLPDGERKAELLFRTGDFAAALAVLERLRHPNLSALYLRARLNEETGNDRLAVAAYQAMLQKDFPEAWRLAAAKRLYLLSAFYGVQTQASEAAVQLLVQAEPQLVQKLEARRVLLPAAEDAAASALLAAEPAEQFSPKNAATASATETEISELRQELYRARQMAKVAAENTPRPARVRILQNEFPALERFELKDGNVVFGIVSRDSGAQLLLLTAVGAVQLQKSQIVRREQAQLGSTGKAERQIAGNLVQRLLEPQLSRAERRNLLAGSTKTLDRLILRDGNEVIGLVYAQNAENISIISVLGPLHIPAELILVRETIYAKTAFRE